MFSAAKTSPAMSHCIFAIWQPISKADGITRLEPLLASKRPEETVLFRFLFLMVPRIVLCTLLIYNKCWLLGRGKEKYLGYYKNLGRWPSKPTSSQQNLIATHLTSRGKRQLGKKLLKKAPYGVTTNTLRYTTLHEKVCNSICTSSSSLQPISPQWAWTTSVFV